MSTHTSASGNAFVPLCGSNYATWKVQCQMALMKDGLWSIVTGAEVEPDREDANKYVKFEARRDRTLAIIVLAVDPSLLYLLGDPEDPKIVWGQLKDQFQKATWANKLSLRRKLYSLQLKDNGSIQDHIKSMTETFNELSVVGDPISEEDRVVHLLASLPDSFNMLVTALEANAEVPKMEVVTERLLHEEQKVKGREGVQCEKAMAATKQRQAWQKKKGPKCHHCGKTGHIKRECYDYLDKQKSYRDKGVQRHGANKANVKRSGNSSDSESVGLIVRHALSTCVTSRCDSWIVDSGATCHMSNDSKLFADICELQQPLEVSLGDGHSLEARGRGDIHLTMKLSTGKSKNCTLHNVLYVPELSYNLFSVTRAAEAGMSTVFDKVGCEIQSASGEVVATATRVANLYKLACVSHRSQANTAINHPIATKELWYKRYGHLGVTNLDKLATDNLVDGLDYNVSDKLEFCEACVDGKHHRTKFPTGGGNRSDTLLGLVHSDVCGKMDTESLSGAQYFLTFIDDKSRYTWVYILKRKDEVFSRFCEWKAMVEKSTGEKVMVLRTDNGGEYTSTEFITYLKNEGIRHELTVPKTPEQNGVAERMNRTVVETVRSMLSEAKLPHKFWAEAVSTAVYLRNRSPTNAVDGMTPSELLTGVKPNVKHLKVFGCEAYAHIPKDERRKLDSKARKCIFMGYGTETKGYRLYDVNRARVIHSRDVLFDESTFRVEKEPACEPQRRYVELDFAGNDEQETEGQEIEDVVEEEPGPRRPGRNCPPPDRYGEWVNVLQEDIVEPATPEEAMAGSNKLKWKSAMEKELKSLDTNDVWDLVELPPGRKAVGSKWVFKIKVSADGSVERYKSRVVAQGYSQRHGQDYDETFSPVIRPECVRTIIALAAKKNLKLHQMDVTTAFLNGTLEEEVYMKQPEGSVKKGEEHLVCRLKKSIYGLKQSSRCWNTTLDHHLKTMGLQQSSSDPCLYKTTKGEMVIVAVYVDDILLAAESNTRLAEVKKGISDRFEAKDLGELKSFLGVKISQRGGEIWLGQPGYSKKLLEKFGMKDAKPVSTPVDTSIKLTKDGIETDGVDHGLYQSAVGSLLYLSLWTRPDITYAVSCVARFCANPLKEHWTAVKRIFRYLKGTQHLGLKYTNNETTECAGYCDADWAGNIDDRKSTSGYLFSLSGAPVSWRSKKQSCVALSTAEAEYVALASAAQEVVWLRQLTDDLGCGTTQPTIIHEDNQSAIAMAKHPQFHGKMKHVAIKYHFIRDQVDNGTVVLKYCKTEDMLADILTKGLPRVQFEKLRQMIGVKAM